MAVLIEAISVVVRCDAVKRSFRGGWQGFVRSIPNGTFCTDGVFARIGFMSPKDVEAYVSTLEAGGLIFQRKGQAVDLAVVDQLRGPTLPASWLEYGQLQTSSMNVAACWPSGEKPEGIALPDGWKYENSMSSKSRFVPQNVMDDMMEFRRHENGLDVYMDLRTGKEMFVGRPAISGDSKPALFTRLEGLNREVMAIEARMQPLLERRDEKGLATLFDRLSGDLLKLVKQIAEGAGREMAFAHFTLGLILRILRRQEEAEREFRKANELQPGVINTLLELVRCLGEQGRHQEALPFARQAIEAAPVDTGAWGNLAMCLIQCGEREEARRAIDYAIQLDPEDSINNHIRDNFESYFQES